MQWRDTALKILKKADLYVVPFEFTFLSDGDSKPYVASTRVAYIWKCFSAKGRLHKPNCKKAWNCSSGSVERSKVERCKNLQAARLFSGGDHQQQRWYMGCMYCAVWVSSILVQGMVPTVESFCPGGEMSYCKRKRAQTFSRSAHPTLPSCAFPKQCCSVNLPETYWRKAAATPCKSTNAECSWINTKIWLLCRKTKFVTHTIVDRATAVAVLWLKKGRTGFEQALQEIGVLLSKELLSLNTD